MDDDGFQGNIKEFKSLCIQGPTKVVIVDYTLEASECGRTISESNLVTSSATHVDELKVSLHASSKTRYLKYLLWQI